MNYIIHYDSKSDNSVSIQRVFNHLEIPIPRIGETIEFRDLIEDPDHPDRYTIKRYTYIVTDVIWFVHKTSKGIQAPMAEIFTKLKRSFTKLEQPDKI